MRTPLTLATAAALALTPAAHATDDTPQTAATATTTRVAVHPYANRLLLYPNEISGRLECHTITDTSPAQPGNTVIYATDSGWCNAGAWINDMEIDPTTGDLGVTYGDYMVNTDSASAQRVAVSSLNTHTNGWSWFSFSGSETHLVIRQIPSSPGATTQTLAAPNTDPSGKAPSYNKSGVMVKDTGAPFWRFTDDQAALTHTYDITYDTAHREYVMVGSGQARDASGRPTGLDRGVTLTAPSPTGPWTVQDVEESFGINNDFARTYWVVDTPRGAFRYDRHSQVVEGKIDKALKQRTANGSWKQVATGVDLPMDPDMVEVSGDTVLAAHERWGSPLTRIDARTGQMSSTALPTCPNSSLSMVRDVEVDDSGKVWVLQDSCLLTAESADGPWTVTASLAPGFRDVEPASDGRVYLGTRSGQVHVLKQP